MADIKILQKMLKVKPLPAKDESNRIVKWPEVEKLIEESGYEIEGTTNTKRLVNFLIAVITALPKQMNKAIKLRKETVHLAGRVWTHLVLKGNTYSNMKKPIRDAVKQHFFKGDHSAGEDFLRDPAVRFDDRDRTIKVNAEGAAIAEKRMENAVVISAERVEKIVEQMKADIDSGDAKYNVVPILLGILCYGSRWVEALMFSKYEVDKKETETGRNRIKTKWVTQTGISKKFNRGVDNRNVTVYKPCLPYVSADYVYEKIMSFRENHTGLTERLLSYNSANPAHKRLANQFRYKANQLVSKRYFLDMLSRTEKKKKNSDQRAASSHLLRAIWVNLSYELFHKRGQAKDKYVKDTLGHDSYEPGVRYKDIMIVPAKEDDALPDLTFGDVSNAELNKAGPIDDEDEDEEDQPEESKEEPEAEEPDAEEPEQEEEPAEVKQPAVAPREDNLDAEEKKNDDDAPITQKQFRQLQKQNADIMKTLMSLAQSVAAIAATLKK